MGIAQIVDKPAAEGSVLTQNGTVVGSSLVGQSFTDPMHFQSRPSGVSNWGPNNPALIENVSQQVAYQKRLNPSISLVPIDLVTQSGSGADPNITPESALLQIPRISNLTGISQDVLTRLVNQYTENPVAGVFGEPRVNVLQLNIALDSLLSPTALNAAQANATALNAAGRECNRHKLDRYVIGLRTHDEDVSICLFDNFVHYRPENRACPPRPL